MIKLRDKFIDGILKIMPESRLNGPVGNKRLCNNVNIAFPEDAWFLGDYLSMKGIYSSKGSACNNIGTNPKPSHVLIAIGRSQDEANRSIRFTLSRYTTDEDIDYVLNMFRGKR